VSRVRTKLILSAVAGLIAAGASLALARVHPFGDAGLYTARAAETPIMEHTTVPPEVRAILAVKCADCHSMQARAPFYGHFAPVSWLMERDIVEARKAMNLSPWEAYSPDRQQIFVAKIVHETKAHEMPPVLYRMIHWDARVKDAEIRTLANWAHVSSGSSGSESNQQDGEGNPVRGKELFEKRCTGCHSLTQNHQGPRLQGVYGRVSGSVADYAYSQTLKNSHITWDEKSLEQWLTDPDAFVPGNNMDFLVPKHQERQDIISYLRQSSGKWGSVHFACGSSQ
jgi:cytochrome c